MSSYCISSLVDQFSFFGKPIGVFLVIFRQFLPKSFFNWVSIDLLNLWIDPLCAQCSDQESLNESWIDPPRSIPPSPCLSHTQPFFSNLVCSNLCDYVSSRAQLKTRSIHQDRYHICICEKFHFCPQLVILIWFNG